MYNTPFGERVLAPAERRLFVTSVGMMLDLLSTDEYDLGIPVFDNLQLSQKIAVLHTITHALLREDVPAPDLTAVIEGGVASVYQHIRSMIVVEIETLEDDPPEDDFSTWRQLASAAGQGLESEEIPDPDSVDDEDWDFLIECLEGQVLWDHDWNSNEWQDASPDRGRHLKSKLGISDDYYITVPPEPTDEQAEWLLAELRELIAEHS